MSSRGKSLLAVVFLSALLNAQTRVSTTSGMVPHLEQHGTATQLLVDGKPSDILLEILAPIDTSSLTFDDVTSLRDRVRRAVIDQIAEWRSVPPDTVDGLVPVESRSISPESTS